MYDAGSEQVSTKSDVPIKSYGTLITVAGRGNIVSLMSLSCHGLPPLVLR
jgi:hypothetical protein